MSESFFGKIVERAGAVFDQIANEYIVFDNLVRATMNSLGRTCLISAARPSKRHPQAFGN